jgi:hypothetical protein
MPVFVNNAMFPDTCVVCRSTDKIIRIKILKHEFEHVISLCPECYKDLKEGICRKG